MTSGSEIFIDASALLAILLEEPAHATMVEAIVRSERRSTSPVALVEVAARLLRGAGIEPSHCESRIQRLLDELRISVVEIDADIGRVSREAMYHFGKGRHQARLNLGDCFAYACAKRHGLALLFKGDDFVHTDIEPALRSG
jgi:ribonuclease VapC